MTLIIFLPILPLYVSPLARERTPKMLVAHA